MIKPIKIPIKKWYTKIRFKITHAALQINSAIIIPQQGKTATILNILKDLWFYRNPNHSLNITTHAIDIGLFTTML